MHRQLVENRCRAFENLFFLLLVHIDFLVFIVVGVLVLIVLLVAVSPFFRLLIVPGAALPEPLPLGIDGQPHHQPQNGHQQYQPHNHNNLLRAKFFFPTAVQYPSIIRANNLCYSTMVMEPKYEALPGVEYYDVTTGMGQYKFAQSPQGVVPALLEDLAEFRKKAKKDMAAAKEAGDDWAAALFNGKQMAYKTTMNSVYGFLGATKGMLPCVPIAASVTATGRAMIQQTKDLVERLVPGSNVVYGDTGKQRVNSVPHGRVRTSTDNPHHHRRTRADSVMVIFNVGEARRHDLQAHFEVAGRIAAEISATFKRPNELEFEKCYYPYLLFSKKRYAGEFFSVNTGTP